MLKATSYFDAALIFLNTNFETLQLIKNLKTYKITRWLKARYNTVTFHHCMPY